MKRRWRLGGAVLALALAMGAPLAAHANDPVSFGSSPIVDTAGALGGDTARVESALASLYADTRMQLFVAFVDTFENPSNANDWATTTATINGLGDNDYLLVVAVNDRNYHFSVSNGSPLSVAQTDDIQFDRIEPMLAQDRWADAAIAAADGLRATQSGGFPWGWLILGGVALVGVLIFVAARSRRKAAADGAMGGSSGPQPQGTDAPSGPPPVSTKDLKHAAGSALVDTDDAIRSSTEELGFAIAQYGTEATEQFRSALIQAQALIRQAFELQQKLDDAEPDTEEQIRAWYTQIATLCEQANQLLDDQADAFAELRKLEKDAPAALARTQELAGQLTDHIDTARRALSELAEQYAPVAVVAVAENPDQAEERITFARFSLKAASEKLAANDSAEAAVGIRAAEEAIAQAAQLLAAVDKIGSDLHAARQAVEAGIANLESDVAAAQVVPVDAASASLPAIILNTQQAIARARVPGPKNPLELMSIIEAANTQIDQAMEGVRSRHENTQRTLAALEQTLLTARSNASIAEQYIATRRGAIDSVARTRVAEAGRILLEAEQLRASNPQAALQRAQRADSLAVDALRYAQQDVNAFDGDTAVGGFLDELFGGSSSGGSYGGTRSRQSDGGDIFGAILGGMLSGNGGSSRSGWGSSSRSGSRSGGSIFGSGSSSRRPSSFGGSRSAGRRGGGGRF